MRSAEMNVMWKKILGGVAIFAAGGFIVSMLRQEDPTVNAERLTKAISQKDWSTAYSLMSPEERQRGNWTEEKLARFANSLVGGYPTEQFNLGLKELIPNAAGISPVAFMRSNERRYYWDAIHQEGDASGYLLVVRRSENGRWFPDTVQTILYANSRFGTLPERMKRLKVAMDQLNLQKLVVFGKGVADYHRLDQVIKTGKDATSIYVSRR